MTDAPQLGPFKLGERIGEGGMGVVYRGKHGETDMPVAIKVIRPMTRPGARRRFHEEVRAHAGLLHPNVVYLFEYGHLDASAAEVFVADVREGNPYVAMELADRGTVRDRMPLRDWPSVRRLLVQILDALAFAHARGVVHRDLKPENLLVFEGDGASSESLRVKLADFGIAHALGGERDARTDELESPAGTPLYMSPEQLKGLWRDYGPWTDLYALGCLTWELVCGRPPFRGDIATLAVKHETEPRPPLVPQFPVPEGLEAWIHRAMASDHRHRFRRAADAARALPGDGVESATIPEATATTLPADPSGSTEVASDTERMPETMPVWKTQPVTLTADTLGEAPAHAETLPPSSAAATGDDLGGDGIDMPVRSAPSAWRPGRTDPLPTPLLGTGLGLFGLREPPFVDRRDEGDRIWEGLRQVAEGDACEYVFICGEAGTGKSRLAEWMATRAHELGAARTMRAFHTAAGGDSEGLRGAFERTLRTVKMDRGELHEHLRDELRPLAAHDAASVERDARALTEYLRPTDEDADTVDGPRYRFADARQQHALIARTLTRLADARPLVLWLDDLQWSPETLGVLEFLADMPGDPPALLVLATIRSDIVSEQPTLERRLDNLVDTTSAERLALEPLSKNHQRELLDGLLPLEEDLADRLAERTEGHPLFAMQLLGHWIERDDLEVGDRGFRVRDGRELAVPEDIHELWLERLDRMLDAIPPANRSDALEALELAAALGREVDEAEWRAVLAEADVAWPTDLVNQLFDGGLLERTDRGCAFTHGLLVDSLARRAREAGRWQGHHRHCARTLQHSPGRHRPEACERVADHWIEAGDRSRALAPLLEAVKLWRDWGKYEERQNVLDRRSRLLDVLQIPDDDPRRLEQRIERAKLAILGEEIEYGRSTLTDVWDQLDSDQARLQGETASSLARAEVDLGRPRRGRKWIEAALEASARTDNHRLQSRCHRFLAWQAFHATDFEQAEWHTDRALEHAERMSNRFVKLGTQILRAWIWLGRDDRRCIDLFETIQRRAAEAGYTALEARALNGLGDWERFHGERAKARELYRRFMQTAVELSQPMYFRSAHRNLAQLALRSGELERASTHLQAADAHLPELGGEARSEPEMHLIRLAYAAGRREGETYASLWSRLTAGWPEEWEYLRDYPWLLETVADHAEEAGWEERAREARRLAADLWHRLGDEEAAEALEDRIA